MAYMFKTRLAYELILSPSPYGEGANNETVSYSQGAEGMLGNHLVHVSSGAHCFQAHHVQKGTEALISRSPGSLERFRTALSSNSHFGMFILSALKACMFWLLKKAHET